MGKFEEKTKKVVHEALYHTHFMSTLEHALAEQYSAGHAEGVSRCIKLLVQYAPADQKWAKLLVAAMEELRDATASILGGTPMWSSDFGPYLLGLQADHEDREFETSAGTPSLVILGGFSWSAGQRATLRGSPDRAILVERVSLDSSLSLVRLRADGVTVDGSELRRDREQWWLPHLLPLGARRPLECVCELTEDCRRRSLVGTVTAQLLG